MPLWRNASTVMARPAHPAAIRVRSHARWLRWRCRPLLDARCYCCCCSCRRQKSHSSDWPRRAGWSWKSASARNAHPPRRWLHRNRRNQRASKRMHSAHPRRHLHDDDSKSRPSPFGRPLRCSCSPPVRRARGTPPSDAACVLRTRHPPLLHQDSFPIRTSADGRRKSPARRRNPPACRIRPVPSSAASPQQRHRLVARPSTTTACCCQRIFW
mmetsp:Transcript_26056/g.72706  ORF Transcript_26056/g.72706 Transcript_26056/m.72706 type:complete len:213 (-) Transcript_26056:956-1594(-)